MLKAVCIVLSCLLSCSALALDFEAKVAALKGLPLDEFMQQLPIEEYLQAYSLADVKQLERHRNQLYKNELNGDDFLVAAFQHHITSRSINFENLETTNALLQLGEIYSHSNRYLPDSVFIYRVGSDMIFEAVADTLQSLIDTEAVNAEDFNVKYAIQRLMDNKYFIELPINNWTKLGTYIREGRWDYIYHKFTSTYKKEFITALLLGGSFLASTWYFFSYWRRKRNKE